MARHERQDEESPDERPEGWWRKWIRNGRASSLIWVIGVGADVTLRILNIPAPEVDGMLAALTGLVIGNLTVKSRD